jgi:integrase
MATKGHRAWGSIRKLPSGRFQASYIGPDGLRHTAGTTYSVRIAAEGWLADERRLTESGDWLSPAQRDAQRAIAGLTLAEYADSWLAQRDLKPRTKAHYRATLDAHINPTLGAVPLRALNPATVRAWYASTLTDRPTYRAHAYRLLHAICATAFDDEYIDANPCRIKGAGTTTRKRDPVILEVAEVAAVAEAITPRFKALVLIAAWCGLRFGELIELRRKDIGEGAALISVSRGVAHRQGCHVDTPKSGRSRNVVVPPHIRADIKAHLDEHVAADAEALLFTPVNEGCHLSDKTFGRHLKAALATVGHDGVTIHMLRHFAGTQTARVANLVETMGRLGHSTVAASLLYQQQVSGRDVEIAEALSRLAEGAVVPDRDT